MRTEVIFNMLINCAVVLGPACRFPVDWKGHYYQSGVGSVVIRGAFVTTKGVCVEQERDYYLFSNRSLKRYQHSSVLYRTHAYIAFT